MSVKIELCFDHITEAIVELRRLADAFASVQGVDTSRHSDHIPETASGDTELPSGAMVEGTAPADRKSAKRASRKPEADQTELKSQNVERDRPCPEAATPPEPQTTEAEDKTDTDAAAPVAGKDEVERLVTAIMVKFHEGDTDMKLKIRAWRDSVGLPRLSDLKPEHVPGATDFLQTLG
jgi:hypothetical protein